MMWGVLPNTSPRLRKSDASMDVEPIFGVTLEILQRKSRHVPDAVYAPEWLAYPPAPRREPSLQTGQTGLY